MSMFFCARCDNLRDSDEGCEEVGEPDFPPFSLLCIECGNEYPEPKEPSQ